MARPLIRGAALLLLAPGLAAASPASPDEPIALTPDARAHLDAGLQAYQDRRYDLAIQEVRAAQKLDPHPELDYTLGQIERHRGNCKEALVHYRVFLEAAPDPSSARAAQTQIDACGGEPKARAASAPSPSLPPPWYRDRAGAILFGLGLAVAGGATALLVDASQRVSAAATGYDRFASARGVVPIESGSGLGAAAVSAVLLAAGVTRWIDRALVRRRAAASLSLRLAPGTAALTVGGSF
jgi:hypothetical protein